jgi:hypothetical protein
MLKNLVFLSNDDLFWDLSVVLTSFQTTKFPKLDLFQLSGVRQEMLLHGWISLKDLIRITGHGKKFYQRLTNRINVKLSLLRNTVM